MKKKKLLPNVCLYLQLCLLDYFLSWEFISYTAFKSWPSQTQDPVGIFCFVNQMHKTVFSFRCQFGFICFLFLIQGKCLSKGILAYAVQCSWVFFTCFWQILISEGTTRSLAMNSCSLYISAQLLCVESCNLCLMEVLPSGKKNPFLIKKKRTHHFFIADSGS